MFPRGGTKQSNVTKLPKDGITGSYTFNLDASGSTKLTGKPRNNVEKEALIQETQAELIKYDLQRATKRSKKDQFADKEMNEFNPFENNTGDDGFIVGSGQLAKSGFTNEDLKGNIGAFKPSKGSLVLVAVKDVHPNYAMCNLTRNMKAFLQTQGKDFEQGQLVQTVVTTDFE